MLAGCGVSLAMILLAALALRSMWIGKARGWWWYAWWILGLLGGAAGVYCSNIDYQVDPTLRATGFPMPIVLFELENGKWVDFVNDLFPVVFLINALALAAALLTPLSITALVRFGLWPRRFP